MDVIHTKLRPPTPIDKKVCLSSEAGISIRLKNIAIAFALSLQVVDRPHTAKTNGIRLLLNE